MTKFSIPDMSCGHCKSAIEKAVKNVDDHAQVEVDLTTRKVTIKSKAEVDALVKAIKAEGYEAHPV